MKRLVAGLMLAAAALSCAAQGFERENLFRRIESRYGQTAVFTNGSPFLEDLLQAVRSANPGVAEDLIRRLRPELGAAAEAAVRDDSGASGRWLRAALAGFNDAELQRLASMLEDPVYARFQAALASPAAQSQWMQVAAVKDQRLGAAVNAVLARYGLRGVQ